MTFSQGQTCMVENNGQYTYFGIRGNYARVQNNKINTVHQYKVSSSDNRNIYCVFIGHEGGSFKFCSENKKMMDEFMSVLPNGNNIKRFNRW